MFAKGTSASLVFHEVHARRRVSKQVLANALGLSLPTIGSGLGTLEHEGLVERRGTYASTGGRPATAYELVADSRYAIGVELVADRARLAAVDLYGTVLAHVDEPLPFSHEDAYFNQVGNLVSGMTSSLESRGQKTLGITVSIQGIVGDDGRVTFGGLLGADEASTSREDFEGRLPQPLRFVHDAEAAAFAELWRHREMRDFAYLSLNDHLGSAIVHEGGLVHGGPLGAGVVEHMVLHPDGLVCYCGGRGCAETTLGARTLERRSGLPLPRFFELVRAGDKRCVRMWDDYLNDLALLVHNVRMVTCADVVVGGRLASYLAESDLRELRMRASGHGALAATPFRLVCGQFADRATVVGAGLILVDEFLSSI